MKIRLNAPILLLPILLLGACGSSRFTESRVTTDTLPIEYLTVARGTLSNPIEGDLNLDTESIQIHKITSPEQWEAYLDQAMPDLHERKPLSRPDFKNEIVLALSAGQRPSSGYGIRINSIRSEVGTLIISATETVPGQNCMLLTVLTWPYHYVQVTGGVAEHTVELERTEFIQDC